MGIGRKDAAELVGIGAIVASLIFVGLELRQSQQIAIAGQYQDRTETYSVMMFERQALRPNSKIPANAVRSQYADVTPKSRFDSMTDEEIAIESVSALRRSEFMRAEVAVRGGRYRDSFLNMVRDIVSEIENQRG